VHGAADHKLCVNIAENVIVYTMAFVRLDKRHVMLYVMLCCWFHIQSGRCTTDTSDST